ncbi:hypothetical protein [Leptodesmis sp.]|uniref:hypothetical protein n=1 Tax=Leptodesmis sp. TaxID=3100501 RepID=UPI0040534CC1
MKEISYLRQTTFAIPLLLRLVTVLFPDTQYFKGITGDFGKLQNFWLNGLGMQEWVRNQKLEIGNWGLGIGVETQLNQV